MTNPQTTTVATLADLEGLGAEVIHYAVREPEGWRVSYSRHIEHICSAKTYADGSKACARCGTVCDAGEQLECRSGGAIIEELRRVLR